MSGDPRSWSPSERPDWEREADDQSTRRRTSGLYRWYRWMLLVGCAVLVVLLLSKGSPY